MLSYGEFSPIGYEGLSIRRHAPSNHMEIKKTNPIMASIKTTDSELFRTADIWLVGFLLAVGEKYIDIQRTVAGGKQKVYFLFPPEVEARAHDFFNGAELPAVNYKRAIENVKTILFDM